MATSKITAAQYRISTYTDKDGNTISEPRVIIATINGEVYTVPEDVNNTFYQEIQLWVAAGNTITDPGE